MEKEVDLMVGEGDTGEPRRRTARIVEILSPSLCSRGVAVQFEETMRQLYVVGWDEGKTAILKDLKVICFAINKKIGTGRNKRQRFFESLLEGEYGHGYHIICFIEGWKKDFDDIREENTTLDMVLREWGSQRDEATTHDTLYHVLCKRNDPVEYRCSALLRLSKRIRGGQDAYNSQAVVADRIVKQALAIYEEHKNRDEVGNAEDYESTPAKYIDLSLRYQSLYNKIRFGNMKEVEDMAISLEKEIDEKKDLRDLDWRPDIRLKWWTWQCRLRAAAYCSAIKKWEKAQGEMFDLETKAEEEGIDGLADRLREMRGARDVGPPKPRSRREYVARMRNFLISWQGFVENEDDAMALRQLRRGRMDRQMQKRANELGVIYKEFSGNMAEFFKALHTSPTDIPTSVKHSYSTTTNEKLIRSEKILAEISHAHLATVVKKSEHTCFVLEILHRLLIYRLWWESLNYTGRDYNKEKKYRFDKKRCCFDIDHVKGVLEGICSDLKELHIQPVRGCKEIRKSIEMVEGLEGEELDGITDSMRRHLDKLHVEGRTRWGAQDEHDSLWGSGHMNFLGLGYMLAVPEADSYETLDQLMAPIGNNHHVRDEEELAFAEEAKKTYDQFNESEKGLYDELRNWRATLSQEEGGYARYRIVWNSTLKDIVRKRPLSHSDLLKCHGIGERKLELYGQDILDIVSGNSPDSG